MGRHSSPPKTGHRRRGPRPSQLALAALIAVGLVVLFGTTVGGEREVSGTFTGAQSAEQPPPSVAAPPTTAEPSTAVSEPPASDQVNAPESWGVDESSAPMRSESASGSADTTAPPLTAAPAPVAEHFTSCAQAKAAGVSMIPAADPRYSSELDHDGDGTACDRHGDPPTRYKAPPTAPPCTCPR